MSMPSERCTGSILRAFHRPGSTFLLAALVLTVAGGLGGITGAATGTAMLDLAVGVAVLIGAAWIAVRWSRR